MPYQLTVYMRNSEMTKLRDRKMVETFYQLYDIKRIRLDDVLKQMSLKMFFLDTNYIYKRIFYVNDNLDYYERLKEGRSKGANSNASQQQLTFGF